MIVDDANTIYAQNQSNNHLRGYSSPTYRQTVGIYLD